MVAVDLFPIKIEMTTFLNSQYVFNRVIAVASFFRPPTNLKNCPNYGNISESESVGPIALVDYFQMANQSIFFKKRLGLPTFRRMINTSN